MRALHQDIGTTRAPHDYRKGSALVAVLGVSMILMLAGVTMVVLSRQSMHRVQRTAHYAQAQAVAKAGVADMTAKLGTNYTLWQSAFHTEQFFSNGAYYVTTQLTNGNVLITSDGIYMEASNRTIMELLGTFQSRWNTNNAIMAGGDVRFSTAAYTMNGNIHANQDVEESNGGKNGDINGDVSAVGDIGELKNVYSTNDNASVVTIPPEPNDVFNFDNYRQMATNGGTYLEGDQTTNGTPIASPANGILYVNGSLTINGGTFTGTIVVNGDITVNNNFTHTKFSPNMPSLLSTGNIKLNNKETYYGIIYAKGNVIIQNTCTIYDGVISGGYTEIRNNVTIYPGSGPPVWDPLNPVLPLLPGGWLK